MITENFKRYFSILDCFASEDRIRILGVLAQEDLSLQQLSVRLEIRTAKISHHLSLLNEVNLVRVDSIRNSKIYSLNKLAVEQLSKDLHVSESRIDEQNEFQVSDDWERKVLNTFVENDQIKGIPIRRKKRQVILNWLIDKFEKGVHYKEKEVNEIILRYHPDKSTLRREFIINKLMAREDGGSVYWRL